MSALHSSGQPERRVSQLTPMAAVRIQPEPGFLRKGAVSEHRGAGTGVSLKQQAACCMFNLMLHYKLNKRAFSETMATVHTVAVAGSLTQHLRNNVQGELLRLTKP